MVPSTSEIKALLDYRIFNLQESNGESRCLGEGSAGRVISINFTGIRCARKDQLMSSEVQLHEFEKQASKLSKLSQTNVMKLLGFYTTKISDQRHERCLLMERMGGTLYEKKELILDGGADDKISPFQHRVAVDLMIQIAKGVRYLHENDVPHHDL